MKTLWNDYGLKLDDKIFVRIRAESYVGKGDWSAISFNPPKVSTVPLRV
jgi:hypothetical protein